MTPLNPFEPLGPWAEAYALELRVAQIIRQQEINGWKIDLPRVKQYIDELEGKVNDIDSKLLPIIPFNRSPIANALVSSPFTQAGQPAIRAVKWLGSPAAGPFSKVEWVPINLDSDDQVKEFLLTQGWKPTDWTYDKLTGERRSPRLTEDSFDSIQGGLGILVSERMVLQHRLGLLNGFLRDVRPDGRIESRANTVGTNTYRMRHSVVVNIPKADGSSFFGKELRSLFITSEGNVLVGYDAKGLETRMLCHYLNDEAMTKLLLEQDIHTRISKLIPDYLEGTDKQRRQKAKGIFYALIYGIGDEKLGRIQVDVRPEGQGYQAAGKEVRGRIMKDLPALDKLIWQVRRASKRGYLLGLDGRKLQIRSEYSAFNTLLQAAGAVVMKVAMVELDDRIKEKGFYAKKVYDSHDEGQLEVWEPHAEPLTQLCKNAVLKAGEMMKLNVPLEADAKIGKSWAETH